MNDAEKSAFLHWSERSSLLRQSHAAGPATLPITLPTLFLAAAFSSSLAVYLSSISSPVCLAVLSSSPPPLLPSPLLPSPLLPFIFLQSLFLTRVVRYTYFVALHIQSLFYDMCTRRAHDLSVPLSSPPSSLLLVVFSATYSQRRRHRYRVFLLAVYLPSLSFLASSSPSSSCSLIILPFLSLCLSLFLFLHRSFSSAVFSAILPSSPPPSP